MTRQAEELSNQRFGRLLVLARCASKGHGGKPRWMCICDCGQIVNIPAARLKSGSNRSCGCFRRDRMGGMYRTHGKSKTPEYMMFYDARKRAQKLNLPFDITPDDIVIPEICPVLNILMNSTDRNHAPSLDRIIPSLGYVKSNIKVISFRANRMKGDASVKDLERLISYIKGEI
ncbi:MAG: hypothetical protein [Siphoviridae sp. ctdc_1]|nr:MAG: hypothetical protein [Siphoviridae sp. ctdc_1]